MEHSDSNINENKTFTGDSKNSARRLIDVELPLLDTWSQVGNKSEIETNTLPVMPKKIFYTHYIDEPLIE